MRMEVDGVFIPLLARSLSLSLFQITIDKQEETKKKEIRKAGYWEDRKHRREFLLDFAKNMGFDPAIASNWKGTKFKIQASQVKYRL